MVSISRRGLLSACLSLVALIGATSAVSARPITGVVTFGDSLSDTGRTSALFGGAFPQTVATGGQSAYAPGRFTNGPTWAEGFSAALGVPLDNQAYGGAFTNTLNTANPALAAFGLPPNARGMATQVSSYIGGGTVSANNLYVLWGGANNYFSGETNPLNPVNDIATQINSLAAAGAKQFLVVNLPSLGNTPGAALQELGNPGTIAGLNLLTAGHNLALSAAIGNIQTLAPSLDIKLFDVNALFGQVLASPATFGLTNVTDRYVASGSLGGQVTQGFQPTVVNPAANVSQYFFYDEIHPTAATHSIIAQRALAVVIPEGGTAGLLAMGGSLLGVGGVLVRRRRLA